MRSIFRSLNKFRVEFLFVIDIIFGTIVEIRRIDKMVIWKFIKNHYAEKRAISWFGTLVSFQIFLGACVLLDRLSKELDISFWLLSVIFYGFGSLGIIKFVPSESSVAKINPNYALAEVMLKASLAILTSVFSCIVRIAAAERVTSLGIIFTISWTSAVVFATLCIIPKALRNVREDLVTEVLQS